jgi:predicted transcriptional regulator
MSDDDVITALEKKLEEGLEIDEQTIIDPDDRRMVAYKLRLRGHNFKDIGIMLNVTPATASKYVDSAAKATKLSIDNYDPKQHVAEMAQSLEDIIHTGWDIVNNTADPEVKLKALQEVRKAINDKQKAVMNAGLISGAAPTTNNTLNFNLMGDWTEDNIDNAIAAVLGLRLTTPLKPPQPDLEEVVEESAVTKVIDIADVVEVIPVKVSTDVEDEDEDEYED